MTVHGFEMALVTRRLVAGALALLIPSISVSNAVADGAWPANTSVEIGVDALGLIEWWEQSERKKGRNATRSSATFRADSRTLLFHCGPGAGLVISMAPLAANGSTDFARRSAFRCQADEALYGDPGGSFSCLSFSGRIGYLPPGPVEIVINGAEPLALTGVCMDSRGALAPAFMPQSLSDSTLAPESAGDCPKSQSSVSFRGKRRTGACAP